MKKFTNIMEKICDVIEVVLSVLVGIATVAALISILPDVFGIIASGMNEDGLTEILEEVFTVVIAVEFLKMLLKPTSLTVIEVLIFLIARHMILQQTTPAQDLLSVIGICLLLAAKLIIGHYKKYQSLPGFGRPTGASSGINNRRTAQGDDGTLDSETAEEIPADQVELKNQQRQMEPSDQIVQPGGEDSYPDSVPVDSTSKDPNKPERVGRGPVERRVYHDVVRELDSGSEKNAHE
jgi:uncharacterized membrane protein (DUF373 family)